MEVKTKHDVTPGKEYDFCFKKEGEMQATLPEIAPLESCVNLIVTNPRVMYSLFQCYHLEGSMI